MKSRMANNGNNANQNNPLSAIQPNALNVSASKEGAWKVLPGAKPRRLPQGMVEAVQTKLVNKFLVGYMEEKYPGRVTSLSLTSIQLDGVARTSAELNRERAECLVAINETLITNQGIVSGGFILWALGVVTPRSKYNTFQDTDIDIDLYVPAKNIVPFYSKFAVWFDARNVRAYNATTYCPSFLRKNGIRRVYTFHNNSGHYSETMDIMAVRNSRKPTDVVQNFDLTFCQNWYDGKMLYSTHPEHLDHKVGYLQGEYVPLFISHNTFLRKRCMKYTNRGFDIRLDPKSVFEFTDKSTGSVLEYFCHRKQKIPRDANWYTLWASKALFQFITTKKYNISNHKDIKNLISYNKKYTKGNTVFPDDGYDSDEYTITKDDQTEKDRLKPKWVELAKSFAESHDATLAPRRPEEKFWQLVTRWISFFHSNKGNNPFASAIYLYTHGRDYTEDELQYVATIYEIPEYLKAIKNLFTRIDMDPVSLDDVQVFDFHTHKLEEGGSKVALDGVLSNNYTLANKDEIPCYILDCGRYLTRDDVRPFVDPAIYKTFIDTLPPVVPIPLGTLTDWGEILRNQPKATDAWGAINRYTMCPFCLREEERTSGCAYMQHKYTGTYDSKKSPFCSPEEQVKELWDKYKAFQSALPSMIPGESEALEFCAICGRPCHGHQHFDLANPGKIIKSTDYGKCSGGGRVEMIARMLACRKVLMDHKANDRRDDALIRREAVFAADAAPLDPALMARAAAILAKAAAERKFNNALDPDGDGYDGPPPPPGGPGGPRRGRNDDGDEKEGEEGDDEAAVNARIADLFANENELNERRARVFAPLAEEPPAPAPLQRQNAVVNLPPEGIQAPPNLPVVEPLAALPNWAAGFEPGNFVNENNLDGGKRTSRRRRGILKRRFRTHKNRKN